MQADRVLYLVTNRKNRSDGKQCSVADCVRILRVVKLAIADLFLSRARQLSKENFMTGRYDHDSLDVVSSQGKDLLIGGLEKGEKHDQGMSSVVDLAQ